MLHHQHAGFTFIAFANADIMAIQHFLTHLVVGTLNADSNIPEPVRFESIDRTAADSAEAENNHLSLVAIVSVDASELQRMQHSAVARHFVVFVKRVAAHLSVGTPDKHILKAYESLLAIDRRLRMRALLHAMRIAPENAPFAQFFQIFQHRFGQDDIPEFGEQRMA